MGKRGFLSWMVVLVALGACEEPEPVQKYVEVASEHRACAEDEACAVVETTCTAIGCECGVAVNEKHLIHYQKALAECRGQGDLETCDFHCDTPFAKCFNGACVLTDEPTKLIRRGRDVAKVCEKSGGAYVGCPDCPPSERCKSCTPCECPSSDRWTSKGCKRVVRTEPRDIRVELRPSRTPMTRPLRARVHNESRRPIRLKTVCGTPFYQARKKEDQWETQYQLIPNGRCKTGSVEIPRGKNRPFVVKTLSKLSAPSGELAEPGTYRFELTYTDASDGFRYSDTVYSAEFQAISKRSRK